MSEGNGSRPSDKEVLAYSPEQLIDKLELAYNRADGTMTIGGKICNHDVALEMCHRAARVFETQLRIQAAAELKDQIGQQACVQELLRTTRGGRG